MPTFLLDTNAISDLIADHPKVLARLGLIGPGNLIVTCAIVRGEILHGLAKMPDGARRRGLTTRVEAVFQQIPCEPVTSNAADSYAIVKQSRHARGIPLDENDLWIAATAIALRAVLVTRDQDFANTPSLVTENWTS